MMYTVLFFNHGMVPHRVWLNVSAHKKAGMAGPEISAMLGG
jgi:hypothetical protein